MNEKQTIKKLKSLRSIQPNQVILEDIKRGVYQKVGGKLESETNWLQKVFITISLSVRSYRLLLSSIAVILLILFGVIIYFHTQVSEMFLYTKVALASNHYEKAHIALSDISNRYGDKPVTKDISNSLSQELAFTNTQMSGLKLKGEKGKYSAQQCHILYQQYLKYLHKENMLIPQEKDYASVKLQISDYQEQAEKKLHKYPHL